MTKKCVQCGKSFQISESEAAFYKSKKLSLPKRCKECREQNKSGKGNHHKNRNPVEYKSYYVRANNEKSLAAVLLAIVFAVACFILNADSSLTIVASATALITIIKYIVALSTGKVFVQEFDTSVYKYTFYDTQAMVNHYVKHGKLTNSDSMEDYLYNANMVIINKGNLTKTQKEDGDTIFFNPKTKEFVVIAKAGYIRTYFIASDKYYNKQ